MRGSTHIVAGCACAVLLTAHRDAAGVLTGLGFAALGSLISDLDAGGSTAGKQTEKIAAIVLLLSSAAICFETFIQPGISGRLLGMIDRTQKTGAVLVFVAVAALGMLSRHRSFMHSIAAGLVLTGCIRIIDAEVWPDFAIGFASHLLLDLTNCSGMMLLFPWRKRVSLKWFRSGGAVDRIIFTGSLAVLAVSLYLKMIGFLADGFPR